MLSTDALAIAQIRWLMVPPGFDQDDLRALLAELVGERSPARAGADNDNDVGVVGREAVDPTAFVRLSAHEAGLVSRWHSACSKRER
jgi:hypothetical protein